MKYQPPSAGLQCFMPDTWQRYYRELFSSTHFSRFTCLSLCCTRPLSELPLVFGFLHSCLSMLVDLRVKCEKLEWKKFDCVWHATLMSDSSSRDFWELLSLNQLYISRVNIRRYFTKTWSFFFIKNFFKPEKRKIVT